MFTFEASLHCMPEIHLFLLMLAPRGRFCSWSYVSLNLSANFLQFSVNILTWFLNFLIDLRIVHFQVVQLFFTFEWNWWILNFLHVELQVRNQMFYIKNFGSFKCMRYICDYCYLSLMLNKILEMSIAFFFNCFSNMIWYAQSTTVRDISVMQLLTYVDCFKMMNF